MSAADHQQSFASLSGQCALVTGSSSGIGRAIAIELARAGADVVVHYNQSEAAAQETACAVRELGGRADVVQADLGNEADRRRLIEAIRDSRPLDILINNAGVDLLTGDGPGLSYTEKLERLFDIDVMSCVLLCREVGNRMKSQGGVILNIGWDQADRGMEGDSGELFSVAKNAIMGFTRSAALSLAPRVRVNCIAPGWIRTAWGDRAGDYWQNRVIRETPLQRWGTPQDIAGMARFLVSSEAAWITGQVINVNGGAVR